MSRVVRFHENGGPEVLRIDEVEVPPPAADEIQLQIRALGLNRAESMFRSGFYVESPVFPARLGYEASGVVTALGSGVTNVAVGDAVAIIPPMSITRWGAYGETGNFPAAHAVKNLPSLGFSEAAAMWMQYVTAWGALVEIARLRAGEAVIITASSSSVGLAAIQVARSVGAISIATTRTEEKKMALLEAGADHVIVTQDENLAARVNEITGGGGARVAFDPVLGPGFEQLTDALSERGIVFAYGALSPHTTPFPLFAILGKMLTVYGYQYKLIVSDPARLERAKRFVLEGLSSGVLKPVIDKVFSLDQIVEAHRYLESNQQFGKIVVTV